MPGICSIFISNFISICSSTLPQLCPNYAQRDYPQNLHFDPTLTGFFKRTCHFVSNTNKRKVLYLTMVRSIFEHCPVIWRPSSNTTINRFESLQKRAIKWINQDINYNYSSNEILYHIHFKQLNILPIQFRFVYHDLKLFHLIIHNLFFIKLPAYMHFFQGESRLRSTHLYHLSIVSDIVTRGQREDATSKRGFNNSYFYRTHLMWNRLPLSLGEIIRPSISDNLEH